ncbi:tRNA modification GTPase TrmE [Auriculariales sp. MPI-PUGE-AT-0066]|nr:tRNA modification GTPase TrmE [Auriculariales sp. MPI-PUGE-AT-0066]
MRPSPLVICAARATATARQSFYALASPPGKAGVAVYRVSGPQALLAYKAIVRPISKADHDLKYPTPWKLHRCKVVDPDTSAPIDDGLAELHGSRHPGAHVHSGRALSAAILGALSRVPGLRPADPGEFTRTALKNGKMDLTQAEGLRDLLDAETEAQRKVARAVASGHTRRTFEELRARIIGALARVEALIDFGEGEDIEAGTWDAATERVQHLRTAIEGHLADGRRGEILRAGIRVAIFGPPNAGKSSLLNFFARRDAALVTPIAGTTRDTLEVHMDLGGLPVTLVDTAGLRSDDETDNFVERLGIERARQAIQDADLALCVLSLEEAIIPAELEELLNAMSHKTMVVFNKGDLGGAPPPSITPRLSWQISVRNGDGMEQFVEGLIETLRHRFDPDSSEEPIITHARHRHHLERALESLDAFLELPSDEIVLACEELRLAATELGRVVGMVGVEDILDALFKDFCIGK